MNDVRHAAAQPGTVTAVTDGFGGYGPPGYPPPPPGYRPPPPGYGPPPPGYRPNAGVPLPPLASWGRRAVAAILDQLLFLACLLPAVLLAVVAATLDERVGLPDAVNAALLLAFVVLLVGGAVLSLRDQTWQQGKRGQSWGKRATGIRLVRELDLQPLGGGLGLARWGLRVALANATCGLYLPITFLAPLADERNRTLDDRMVQSLVIRPPAPARR